MWRFRLGSCWGWSSCGESSMIKLCQSGRTEIPLPPMILCLSVLLFPRAQCPCPLLRCCEVPPPPGCAPGRPGQICRPLGRASQRCLQLQCARHGSPSASQGPCAGCHLMAGAVLYPGSPRLLCVADRTCRCLMERSSCFSRAGAE